MFFGEDFWYFLVTVQCRGRSSQEDCSVFRRGLLVFFWWLKDALLGLLPKTWSTEEWWWGLRNAHGAAAPTGSDFGSHQVGPVRSSPDRYIVHVYCVLHCHGLCFELALLCIGGFSRVGIALFYLIPRLSPMSFPAPINGFMGRRFCVLLWGAGFWFLLNKFPIISMAMHRYVRRTYVVMLLISACWLVVCTVHIQGERLGEANLIFKWPNGEN